MRILVAVAGVRFHFDADTMKRERKVTVLLNEDEYSTLERYCSEKGCKKSTLLARLMHQHLKQENFPITNTPTTARAPLTTPDK
jgi:hypothetical protein